MISRSKIMGKKYIDYSWDFRNDNTKEFTHCYHSYPAMMIPQVARKLIEKYGQNAKLLFDPYCGTGTSIVEANLKNINAVGTDLNPLARLIAETKTASIDIHKLDSCIQQFANKIFSAQFGQNDNNSIRLPDFQNIDYWFSKEVQQKLALIKIYIDNIKDSIIQKFFKVAFSETVRESSWTKNSEFKLIRMPMEKIKRFNPNVFAIMEYKLLRNRKGLESYLKTKKNGATANIYNFNTVINIPGEILPPESVDLIVTSPPYGDSRTTVAYGQFSRLANQWLGVSDASKVDKMLMGGVKNGNRIKSQSKTADYIISTIFDIDEKRCKDVIAFFADYEKSISHLANIIKSGGYACFVTGNRSVKGITIDTDEITKEFFESNGFEHIETIIRNIPNKRMPSENSPSNVKGKKANTIKNEYIVICRKI
jgi:site-specific DNA-methyltransferase (cytosine-N4-specific)